MDFRTMKLHPKKAEGQQPKHLPQQQPKQQKKHRKKKTSANASPKMATKKKSASKTSTKPRPPAIDFGIKSKCELTAAILSQYEDYQKDSKYLNQYSAVCSVCIAKSDGGEVDRTHFLRGNNSNLKSHLKRVISVFIVFPFFVHFISLNVSSMQLFKTEMEYVYKPQLLLDKQSKKTLAFMLYIFHFDFSKCSLFIACL